MPRQPAAFGALCLALCLLLLAGCGGSESADSADTADTAASAPAPAAPAPAAEPDPEPVEATKPTGPVQFTAECGMPLVADGDRFLQKQDVEGVVLETYTLGAASDAATAELEEAFGLASEAGRQLCVDGTYHPFEDYIEVTRAVVGPH